MQLVYLIGGMIAVLLCTWLAVLKNYHNTRFYLSQIMAILLFFSLIYAITLHYFAKTNPLTRESLNAPFLVILRIISMHVFLYFLGIAQKQRSDLKYIVYLCLTMVVIGYFVFALLSPGYQTITETTHGTELYYAFFILSGLLFFGNMFQLMHKSDKRVIPFFVYVLYSLLLAPSLMLLDFLPIPLTLILEFSSIFFLAVCFLICPNWLLFSYLNVEYLSINEGTSMFPLINVGKTTDFSQSFLGSLLLQKEVSGSRNLPLEITLENKRYAIIESINVQGTLIIGIVIANTPTGIFRDSLKLLLQAFKRQYGNELAQNIHNLQYFQPFVSVVKKIFNGTLMNVKN